MSTKWTLAPGSGISFARVALLGGALIGASGFVGAKLLHRSSAHAYQLVLEVEEVSEPTCYFASHWENDATVLATHDASDARPLTFTQTYPFVDGCWWESTEVLTPKGDGAYSYSYSEHLVKCMEDAEPGIACTRSGTVTPRAVD